MTAGEWLRGAARGRLRRPDRHAASVHRLRLASESGDPTAIAAVLDPGVVMITDGGTDVAGDARIVRGADDVARRICDVLRWYPTEISEGHVNGQSALVLRRQDEVACVVSARERGGLITDLWVVLDPRKLQHWNRPG